MSLTSAITYKDANAIDRAMPPFVGLTSLLQRSSEPNNAKDLFNWANAMRGKALLSSTDSPTQGDEPMNGESEQLIQFEAKKAAVDASITESEEYLIGHLRVNVDTLTRTWRKDPQVNVPRPSRTMNDSTMLHIALSTWIAVCKCLQNGDVNKNEPLIKDVSNFLYRSDYNGNRVGPNPILINIRAICSPDTSSDGILCGLANIFGGNVVRYLLDLPEAQTNPVAGLMRTMIRSCIAYKRIVHYNIGETEDDAYSTSFEDVKDHVLASYHVACVYFVLRHFIVDRDDRVLQQIRGLYERHIDRANGDDPNNKKLMRVFAFYDGYDNEGEEEEDFTLPTVFMDRFDRVNDVARAYLWMLIDKEAEDTEENALRYWNLITNQ